MKYCLLVLVTLVFLASSAYADATYYLAVSGSFGDGSTAQTPIDASSKSKLGSYFTALGSTANITTILGSGTFTTGGIGLYSGWTLKGAGKDATTLILSTTSSGLNQVVGAAIPLGNNMAVEDMTIDCDYASNVAAYGAGKIEAVSIVGSGSHVKNVRAIRPGAIGQETWTFLILGWIENVPHNAYIEGCEVAQMANYVDGFSIWNAGAYDDGAGNVVGKDYGGGNHTAIWATGVRIFNCTMTGTNYVGMGAGTTGGCDGSLLYGNTFTNLQYGFFNDSFSNRNVRIYNNTFTGNSAGIFQNNWPGNGTDNIQIYDNIFNQIPQNCSAIQMYLHVTGGNIYRNTITPAPGVTNIYAMSIASNGTPPTVVLDGLKIHDNDITNGFIEIGGPVKDVQVINNIRRGTCPTPDSLNLVIQKPILSPP